MSNIIWHNVRRQRASLNTKYHCIYGFFFLGLSRQRLCEIYGKSKSTVCAWITYKQNSVLSEKEKQLVYRKFGMAKRQWIVNLYMREPTLFLDEAQKRFFHRFKISICRASIVRILHAEGMSWKKLERRAMQVRNADIAKYCEELSFQWDLPNLVFLDEAAFDSRDMLRNRGYGFVGKRLIFRGEFRRRPRVSTLCFLGQGGLLDSFMTKGTFTRKIFFECCRTFALQSGNVQTYPGFYSVWVMDGARIHCDKHIIMYLRSLGIVPIFLPAYCPFYNPIEIIFGIIKRYLRRRYVENDPKDLKTVVGDALLSFKNYDCTKIIRKCGYNEGGIFDPKVGLNQSLQNFDFCSELESKEVI
ncbi:uncharacterized protein LOC128746041 [Sabethes cyaneus]|uniref:uncharacterized protein LOC128746041 n=1 Tax=Sabethes cyaneus TaxID=53552 RepID=UPI00237E02ED|nr:uncharacterized protein LOC128746041 [Sabethes cyaneus]